MNDKKLNRLAEKIIELLQSKYDAPYVADKVSRLQGQDNFETLLWCRNLDTNNQRALAAMIGVEKSDFTVTLDVIRKIANT